MQKKTVIILAFILLVSAILGSSLFTNGHLWGDDFASYIMQAKSIVNGDMQNFVEHNAYTIRQSSSQIGPIAYPWGYPLLLTPAYILFGISPIGLKLPSLLTYLGFLLVFFFLVRRRFTLTESLLAVSLFAFNPGLLSFLDNILSDMPFLFCSTLSILLADIYVHEKQKTHRLALAAGTGASIFVAFFIRTQGLILLGSVLLFQGFRFLKEREQRKNITFETTLIIAIFGALWGISTMFFPDGQSSYLAIYAGFGMDTFINNISFYSQIFNQFFAMVPGGTLFFLVFVVFCFIGLVTQFRDDLLFILYSVLYLLVVWSWPERQGYRFLFPMLPFFVYFAMQGIKVMIHKVGKKQRPALQKGANLYLLLIVILFAYNTGASAYGNLRNGREINGPFDPYSLEMYDFIREQTPPESVIVFFKPRALRLMTNHDALALTECARLSEGDYLALSKKVGENLQIPPERIGECNLPLDKVFENRRFLVYRVEK